LADAERFELGLMTGRTVDSAEAAREAAQAYRQAGAGAPRFAPRLGLGNLLSAADGRLVLRDARLPRAPKGAGDLLTALLCRAAVRGDALAVALEGATGAVYDVIVRSLAADSEDLLLPEAQDVLEEPVTWPRARFTWSWCDGRRLCRARV
jgi:pyridoxine kinase